MRNLVDGEKSLSAAIGSQRLQLLLQKSLSLNRHQYGTSPLPIKIPRNSCHIYTTSFPPILLTVSNRINSLPSITPQRIAQMDFAKPPLPSSGPTAEANLKLAPVPSTVTTIEDLNIVASNEALIAELGQEMEGLIEVRSRIARPRISSTQLKQANVTTLAALRYSTTYPAPIP